MVEHAVPFNGCGAAGGAGGQDDIGAVVEVEGVAADTGVEVDCGVVGQDDVGAVVEEQGVAVQCEVEVTGCEEVQVVDKLAQAGGCVAQAVVEEAPCTEARVLLVVGEVLAYTVSFGGVEGVRHCQNLLGSGEGVVGAAIGVDFADNIVGAV